MLHLFRIYLILWRATSGDAPVLCQALPTIEDDGCRRQRRFARSSGHAVDGRVTRTAAAISASANPAMKAVREKDRRE
jgi:hypothetical protein